ncbi:serine/threonine-protein kinase [Knoellia sp. LjRoot47]|uniref:serine/threonine-protein kinase n=1 Tax=Knoellia sp. LjRoot47 TaxID=3342330 RepID=UPI003ED10387
MNDPEALIAGRYRLVEVLAAGGMGVVWKAWDERLERSVAVKLLHALHGVPEAEAEEAKHRAMREARITAKLHHPHAVPVFDAVEHDGRPCLVMQLLPSTPLSAVIAESGPLPLGRVATIGSEVASALTAAHALGIVHRDIKPGNILIAPDGGAHISDFGISHALGDAAITRTGLVHGTPAYLAPEVARGEDASYPADVFSLGSTLYAALEGSPPFGSDGNSIALLHKVAAADVPPPTRAGSLTPFLLEMLASEPEDRPSMEAVAVMLADLRPDDDGLDVDTTAPIAAVPGVPAVSGVPAVEAAPAVGATEADGREPDLFDELMPQDDAGRDDRRAPVAAPPRAPMGDDREAEGRRRRVSPLLALVAAVIVAGLVWAVVALLDDDEKRSPSQASPATTQSTPRSPSPSATSPSRTPSATPTTATPSSTPTPTPSPTTPSPRASSTPSPAGSAARLSSAITDYYGVLPENTDAAWPRLTAGYQRSPSGGRDSFERFWGAIADVSVSDVQATPPDRVVATVTYRYENGRVAIERTSYGLVDEGGVLKIASSKVLSSRRG